MLVHSAWLLLYKLSNSNRNGSTLQWSKEPKQLLYVPGEKNQCGFHSLCMTAHQIVHSKIIQCIPFNSHPHLKYSNNIYSMCKSDNWISLNKKWIFFRKSVHQNETPYLFAKTHKSHSSVNAKNSATQIFEFCRENVRRKKRKCPTLNLFLFSAYTFYVYSMLLYIRLIMYNIVCRVCCCWWWWCCYFNFQLIQSYQNYAHTHKKKSR